MGSVTALQTREFVDVPVPQLELAQWLSEDWCWVTTYGALRTPETCDSKGAIAHDLEFTGVPDFIVLQAQSELLVERGQPGDSLWRS